MATTKDYYEILGVSKGAKPEEIAQAYKKLAKEHHPDMVSESDKKDAEKRFKEINEAYQTLKDPQKKQMYDQYGHAGAQYANQGGGQGPFGGFGGQQGGQWGPFTYTYTSGGRPDGQGADFDPFDIFEEFFGFRGFGGQRQPRKGKNLYYEMQVDFVDAVRGAEKKVKIESGDITIKIPQGVHNGTEMRFNGKGMPGPNNTPAGDLFITFRVPVPKEFVQRAGDNFGTVVEINFIQAILGDTIEVPVIDEKAKNGVGTAKLKIPAGTQPSTQFKVKGKGMPKLHGRGSGDVIVQVMVGIPKRLSREQRELLERYKRV